MSLHNDIMNLPCETSRKDFLDAGALLNYKTGHRDARHAAAELAIAYDQRIETLREALQGLIDFSHEAGFDCQRAVAAMESTK